MFDKEKTGVVNVNDLQTIMKSLGRDPQEAMDNPYEYEAQEQFRNESEKLIKELKILKKLFLK